MKLLRIEVRMLKYQEFVDNKRLDDANSPEELVVAFVKHSGRTGVILRGTKHSRLR
jgi:hypothetical protein